MRRGDERRAEPSRRGRRVRAAALGVAVVGVGLLAVALWSAAARAEAAEPQDRGAARRGGGPSFSSFIDDLPIMPGLSETDGGYAFDLSEGGRLAEARLAGAADAAVVRGFYAATLAQLGWRASEHEPYVYHRGGEQLIFLVEPARRGPRRLEAVFVITPAEQAGAAGAPEPSAARLH
jgi:hypothetical protein